MPQGRGAFQLFASSRSESGPFSFCRDPSAPRTILRCASQATCASGLIVGLWPLDLLGTRFGGPSNRRSRLRSWPPLLLSLFGLEVLEQHW